MTFTTCTPDSDNTEAVVGGGGWFCTPAGMCSQTDQITFVVRDQICSLALKTNEPKSKSRKMITHILLMFYSNLDKDKYLRVEQEATGKCDQ